MTSTQGGQGEHTVGHQQPAEMQHRHASSTSGPFCCLPVYNSTYSSSSSGDERPECHMANLKLHFVRWQKTFAEVNQHLSSSRENV